MPRAADLVKTRTRHEVLPPRRREKKRMDSYSDGTESRPSEVYKVWEESHPPLCQSCLSWKSPQRSHPAAGYRLPVFSDMASRGHQDHCTAAPGSGFRAWGPEAQGTDFYTLTHLDGVCLLWDTRWESYPGSCHVEGGAYRGTLGWGKEILALPEAGTSAPGVE